MQRATPWVLFLMSLGCSGDLSGADGGADGGAEPTDGGAELDADGSRPLEDGSACEDPRIAPVMPTCGAGAVSHPPAVDLASIEYGAYTAPSEGPPAYRVEAADSLTGYPVRRIADAATFGTTQFRLRHAYAKVQPWNSDQTLIALAGYPAAILDADTYELLRWSDIPGNATWSHTDPRTMVGVSGNRVVSHDVMSNDSTTLHTFDEFERVEFGYGEGNVSDDDRLIGLIGRNGGEETLVVYDLIDDSVIGTRVLPSGGDLDWFTVSPSGTYAVVAWRADGSGSREGYKIYDPALTTERHLYDHTSHADLGYDAAGDEVVVGYGDESTWATDHYLVMIRLRDGRVTPLFEHSRGIWGGHVSMRNTQRPGWAYVSEACCPEHPVAAEEIFAIRLDGSGTIERYGMHHSDATAGYGHEPMAVPSPDGTKVLFASNWWDAGLSSGEVAPAFVLEVPQGASEGVRVSSPATICPGESVMLVACGADTYEWSHGATGASVTVAPESSTTYEVDGGAAGTASVLVTVLPESECDCL